MRKHLLTAAVLALAAGAVPALAGSSADTSGPASTSNSVGTTSSDRGNGLSAGDSGMSSSDQPTGAITTPTSTSLVGREVVDSSGAKIGKVKDLSVDAQGQSQAIVRVGMKDVSVPASSLQVSGTDKVQSSMTKADFKKLPALDKDAMNKSSGSSTSNPSTGSSTQGTP